MEIHQTLENPFDVELFRGKTVDIVHLSSVQRVANGKKPADISDRRQAEIVLQRIQQLKEAGISVREIDDITVFIHPEQFDPRNDSLIVGGAFTGQCIEAYRRVLEKHGIQHVIHPLLTVRTQ